MSDATLFYMPATELAERIRRRELSPVAVVRAFLERIAAVDGELGAYCTVTAEQALDEARAAEAALAGGAPTGPLHGVPVSIKDLVYTRGVRTTRGSAIYADLVPDEDAPVVERLRAAGAISLGKTNTPEFGWKGLTDNRLFPPTRNPWDGTRTAGGSSGGAAAAVAAGLGPIGIGSDGGGSVRIPGSFCGVVGLKPSFGRIPYYPASAAETMSHMGPLTRTVADTALALDVLAGPDARDRLTLPAPQVPEGSYLAAAEAGAREGLAGLRVGWSLTLGYAVVDDEVAALTGRGVERLATAGGRVETLDLDWTDPEEPWWALFFGGIGAALADYLPEWREQMDPGLVEIVERAKGLTAFDYTRAGFQRVEFWHQVRRCFEDVDILATPTLAVPALPLTGELPTLGPSERGHLPSWSPFSYPFNLTGQPAITVPCGWTAGGLPVGLQLLGRRYDDATVLRAAAAFEAVAPWADRRPIG